MQKTCFDIFVCFLLADDTINLKYWMVYKRTTTDGLSPVQQTKPSDFNVQMCQSLRFNSDPHHCNEKEQSWSQEWILTGSPYKEELKEMCVVYILGQHSKDCERGIKFRTKEKKSKSAKVTQKVKAESSARGVGLGRRP